jgi:hypothetical protein
VDVGGFGASGEELTVESRQLKVESARRRQTSTAERQSAQRTAGEMEEKSMTGPAWRGRIGFSASCGLGVSAWLLSSLR